MAKRKLRKKKKTSSRSTKRNQSKSNNAEDENKVGRPSLFNDAIKEKMLQLYKEGKTNEQVAEIIGVHVRTIENWQKTKPEFMWALKEAKQVADDLVEASLFSRACGYSHKEVKVFQYEGQIVTHEVVKHYPPDPTSMIFWLKNRQPERWRDKDSDVNIEISLAELVAEARARVKNRNKK